MEKKLIETCRITEISKATIGKTVKTFGWVESIRKQGRGGTFIDLFYGFKTLKCLAPTELVEKALQKYEERHPKEALQEEKKDEKDEVLSESARKTPGGQRGMNLTPHSTIYVTCEIKDNFSKKDFHEVEAHITELEIYKIAPSFPLNDESSAYTQLQYGHLNLRRKDRILFLKARDELLHQFREFYYKKKYCEITPPTLVKTQVEGGSTLFHLKYYDEDAYLTQSSQLYLETASPSTGKSYCIMPSYRAEKFNTSRHLSEYTHIEAELSFISFKDLLDEIEMMVKEVLRGFFAAMFSEITLLDKEFEFDFEKCINSRFIRLPYKNAIKILRKNEIYKDKEQKIPYQYGDDISDRDEVSLVDILGGYPIFLIHFPAEHKPFYCKQEHDSTGESYGKTEEDAKLDIKDDIVDDMEGLSLKLKTPTQSVDLLWAGTGEILGGSMRAEKYDDLMEGFEREGIDPSKYYWYTDLRRFNANPHGGYGLGFERLLKSIMKYDTVNKSCLYPRFPGRCEP
ncbi:hypothetical protein EDEG_03801 [Edhazardia aedis USNM 41457]|uniref:asparagine--tRNA ligase n=1 Tax=Edhazardia aedis (strain USNM 41457) TaxID=1003232 RepID=J9DJY0_EDHAE|nr:hypothetical protein EDEG_03801 [Edhazardia aedis USNM 41457]|eukprot:EJW01657.1 hypothetical protein EDEG_03801 [Edhazardia aedis USNM 41457]